MTSTSPKTVIVSADDFGIRETVDPILRLAESGKIDRVATLVRFVTEENAHRLRETKVQLDIHLELIDLLGRGAHEGDHTAKRVVNFLFAFLTGRLSTRKAEEEWRKQIAHFVRLFGRLPDGLNSHEHVHFFPPLFLITLKLAHEYGIPFVRLGKKGVWTLGHPSVVARILSALSVSNRAGLAHVDRVSSSDFLLSLDWISGREDAVLSTLPEGMTELVTHPERPDEYRFLETLRRS